MKTYIAYQWGDARWLEQRQRCVLHVVQQEHPGNLNLQWISQGSDENYFLVISELINKTIMHSIQAKTYSSIHVSVEHKNCMIGKSMFVHEMDMNTATDVYLSYQ